MKSLFNSICVLKDIIPSLISVQNSISVYTELKDRGRLKASCQVQAYLINHIDNHIKNINHVWDNIKKSAQTQNP